MLNFHFFTIKASSVEPYLSKYLPISVNHDIEYVGDDYDYYTHPFTYDLLDVKPSTVYEQMVQILNDNEKEFQPKICLNKDCHETFIYLLFYAKSALKFVNEQDELDAKKAREIAQLIQFKIWLKEIDPKNLQLQLRNNVSSEKIEFDSLVGFEGAIDYLIEQRFKGHQTSIMKSDINVLLASDVNVSELKILKSRYDRQSVNYESFIKIRTTLMLVEFLNNNSTMRLTSKMQEKGLTSHHIRFLLRFYELLKWNFTYLTTDERTGNTSDTNAIKAFRRFFTDVKAKMES